MYSIFNEWITHSIPIPLVLAIVAYFFKKYPPKTINHLYGYRLPSSMKNDDTWREANAYSANMLLKLATATLVCILLVTIFGQSFLKAKFDNNLRYFSITITYLSTAIILLPLIILTELHLKRTFDKNGNRRT